MSPFGNSVPLGKTSTSGPTDQPSWKPWPPRPQRWICPQAPPAAPLPWDPQNPAESCSLRLGLGGGVAGQTMGHCGLPGMLPLMPWARRPPPSMLFTGLIL